MDVIEDVCEIDGMLEGTLLGTLKKLGVALGSLIGTAEAEGAELGW